MESPKTLNAHSRYSLSLGKLAVRKKSKNLRTDSFLISVKVYHYFISA